MDEFVNLKETELRLGLPGTEDVCVNSNKRVLPDTEKDEEESESMVKTGTNPPKKSQIIGWPPVRSYRKNSFEIKKNESDQSSGIYVKVSMDGAPYLRKIDLSLYKGYTELLKGLEIMFKEGYKGSEFVPTYEDKDGDWMLIGDVPWEMFICTCKRVRIMKGPEARGLRCSL